MATLRTAALLLAAIALVGGPAAASDATADGPNPRSEQVWFHCEGDGKVHNSVSYDSIPWTTDAPAQSVTEGAGCGSADNPIQGNNQVSVQDSHFGGYYDGNLDAMTIELHDIYVGAARSGSPLTFNVRLLVDGTPILGEGGKDVTVTPVRSATGISEMVKFTVTGIGLLTEEENLEHDVLLTVSGGAMVSSPLRDTMNGWVYDATEVPSGIVFNPETPEADTVSP